MKFLHLQREREVCQGLVGGARGATHTPVEEPCQEQPAKEAMGDQNGILAAEPLLHVSVEGLQECRDSVVHIGTTARGDEQNRSTASVTGTLQSSPLSSGEAVVEGPNLPAFGHELTNPGGILEVPPLLLSQPGVLTVLQHLQCRQSHQDPPGDVCGQV